MDAWQEGDASALAAFAAALDDVQQVVKTQTAEAGKFSYTYADLADVLAEVKRVCKEHCLSVAQTASTVDGTLHVTTSLISNDPAEGVSVLTFPSVGMPCPKDPQAAGSVITYLRRYSLVTIFAIPVEDDDGKAASKQQQQQDDSGTLTVAERRARDLLGDAEPDVRTETIARFRATFGMGLSDLPASRHGDALAFVVETIPKVRAELAAAPPTDPTTEETQP